MDKYLLYSIQAIQFLEEPFQQLIRVWLTKGKIAASLLSL